MEWYRTWATRLGLNPDPDDPKQHYDYRAAYLAGAKPDASGHWPSEFKTAGHPRRYISPDGVSGSAFPRVGWTDTKTGLVVR